MYKTGFPMAALLGCLLVSPLTLAGDRIGVTEALRTLPATWRDAFFSIDVKGTTADGDAILNQPLDIAYEAALPGYVTYLRISSYGDMTLARDPVATANSHGERRIVVNYPLGSEQVIVLFSSAPLDSFFSPSENSRDIGADRDSAEGFVHRLELLANSNVKLAFGRYRYLVANPGATEYGDSRGIIMHFMENVSDERVTDHIQFELDRSDLTDEGRHELDLWGDALVSRNLRSCSMTLRGHTDSTGSDEHDMDLSVRRARTAKEYLEQKFGIPAERLSAIGMGKDDPIVPNDTDANRKLNRRVDFRCTSRQ